MALLFLILTFTCASAQASPTIPKKKKSMLIQDSAKKADTTRTITVCNKITPAMQQVSYFGTKHAPGKFATYMQGESFDATTPKKVVIHDDTLKLTYEYSFAGGMYKGKKEVEFVVNPKVTSCDVTFSWDEAYRFKVVGAEPKSIKKTK